MSRTNRFVSGISFGYLNMALLTLTGLWLTPFLLHRLGQHDYGLWLVGTQMLGYLALLDVGVVALLPREVAYEVGRSGATAENLELSRLIARTKKLVGFQIPLVSLAAFLMYVLMPSSWADLRHPFALVLVTFVVFFPLRVFQAVLFGLQEMTWLGLAQTASWLISLVLTVVLILAGFRLYSVAAAWIGGQVITTLMWFLKCRTQYPHLLAKHTATFALSEVGPYLKSSVWVSLAQIAQVLLNATDLLIIGRVLGPAAVVPYACTAKLIFVLTHQPQLLMQSALPGLSEMRTGESRERIFRACTSLSLAILMLSGFIAMLVLGINGPFVRWWVGPQFYIGLTMTAVLLANMLLRHWNITATASIYCFGYERHLSIVTLLDGVVTVVSSVVLVRIMGPLGAVIGSTIGVVCVSLPANIRVLVRELGVSFFGYASNFWPWLWRLILLGGTVTALQYVWSPTSIIQIALTALVLALLYLVAMFNTAQESHLGTYLNPRLEAFWYRLAGALRPAETP